MVKEIVIMRDSGLPLYHYSVSGEKKLDELVAGFLSAMGSMAQQVSDQQIRGMSFANSKFVWETKGDLFFIALVAKEDSPEIYKAILRELSDQFVGRFYSELMKNVVTPRDFYSFTDIVETTLQKFNGIPGLARRYETALIPLVKLNELKVAMAATESNHDVFRSALLTNDGYIVASNLRAYELEAVLDQIKMVSDRNKAEPFKVVHTSLDPVTSFFIVPKPEIGYVIFIVRAGKDNEEHLKDVQPLLKHVDGADFTAIKRINPIGTEEVTGFYDYDILVALADISEILSDTRANFTDVTDDISSSIVEVTKLINNKRTILEIQETTGLSKTKITEAIAHLIARGYVKVCKLYPVLGERDERFAAYLEVIGIPKKSFDIVNECWQYCNGAYSIKEMSEKTEIAAKRILDVLGKLGNHVEWLNERVLQKVR